VFIFPSPERNDSQNLKTRSGNFSFKFQYVINFIEKEIFSAIMSIPSFASAAFLIGWAFGVFRHFIDVNIFL